MHVALVFVVVLWAVFAASILFFIFLGLSFVGASSQIQTLVAIAAVALLSILSFRLYRGVRANLAKAKTGNEVIIGARGITTTNLRPKGEVRVKGEFWQAAAEEGWIDKGKEVEVVGIDGLVLDVRIAKELS